MFKKLRFEEEAMSFPTYRETNSFVQRTLPLKKTDGYVSIEKNKEENTLSISLYRLLDGEFFVKETKISMTEFRLSKQARLFRHFLSLLEKSLENYFDLDNEENEDEPMSYMFGMAR